MLTIRAFSVVLALAVLAEASAGLGKLAPSQLLSSSSVRPLQEEREVDGDGEDLEVVVRRHHTHRPLGPVPSRRRRRVGPLPGTSPHQNMPKQLTMESVQEPTMQSRQQEYRATALSQPRLEPAVTDGRLREPQLPSKPGLPPGTAASVAEPTVMRGPELIIGILLGVLISLLGIVGYLNCWPRYKSGASSTAISPAAHGQGLDGGRLGLVQFHYQGAFFNQLSWTLETGSRVWRPRP